MQITPVRQDNIAAQAAPVVPNQAAKPVQEPAQQQQALQKDNVILSQEAKDLAAQLPDKTMLDGLTG